MRSLLSGDGGYAGFAEDKGQGLLSDSHTPTSYYQSKRHLKLLAIVVLVVCIGLVPMLVWPAQTTITKGAHEDSPLKGVPEGLMKAPAMEETMEEETMVEEVPKKTLSKKKTKKTTMPTEAPSISTEHEDVKEPEHTTEIVHEEDIHVVEEHHLPYPVECEKEVKELKDGEHLVLEHVSTECHDAYKKMLVHATTAPIEEVIAVEDTHEVVDAAALELKLQEMQAEMDELRKKLAVNEELGTKPVEP